MMWFEKLHSYFPIEEMKSKAQLDALLSEKGDLYIKDESKDHILLYAEFDSFLFVDFLWVSDQSRGKGIGQQLIQKLKMKQKLIILEVEPVSLKDDDTEKRLRFYKREGFKQAHNIDYRFQAFAAGSETVLDIWYWAEDEVAEMDVYKAMRDVYEQIHTYRVEHFYGFSPKPVNGVVSLKAQ